MGQQTRTPEQIKLERDATRLAGDATILERFRKENTDYHFPRHLDLARNPKSFLAGDLGVKHRLDRGPSVGKLIYKANFLKFTLFGSLPSAHFFNGKNQDRIQAAGTLESAVFDGNHSYGGVYDHNSRTAIELSPVLTPREKLAILAGLPPDKINSQLSVTMAEDDAITVWHEWQHGRSDDTWQNSLSGMIGEAEEVPALAQESEDFYKLWTKTSQAVDVNDLYVGYLSENMSDTVSFLHYLKHGGDPSHIEDTANARGRGFYTKKNAYEHGTFETLAQVAADAPELKKRLNGADNAQIEEIAAGIVGDHTMDRETYYEQALLVQAHCYSDSSDQAFEDINWGSACGKSEQMDKLWREYRGYRDYSSALFLVEPILHNDVKVSLDEFVHNAAKAHGENIRNYLKEVEADLTHKGPPSQQQLQTEVLALFKHQGNKHPAYADAQGEMHLLQIRERVTAQLDIYASSDDTINPAHKELAQHLSQKQTQEQGDALEMAWAQSMSMGR